MKGLLHRVNKEEFGRKSSWSVSSPCPGITYTERKIT